MKEFVFGSIPDRIYILKPRPVSVGWRWENRIVDQKYDNNKEHHTQGSIVLVADADDKRQRGAIEKRARACAGEPITIDNKPFTGVKFVGFDYHATTLMGVYVSLPPGDMFLTVTPAAIMDAIMAYGVQKGGEIPGEFIFAKCDQKMSIVRVGSAMHKACIEADIRRKTEVKQIAELTPGKVYRTVKGDCAVLLGLVNTASVVFDYTPEQKLVREACLRAGSACFSKIPPDNWKDIKTKILPWKMATVWCPVYHKPTEADTKDPEKFISDHKYAVEVKKTHQYVEEIPGLYFDFPLTVLENVRQTANRGIKNIVEQRQKHIKQYGHYYREPSIGYNAFKNGEQQTEYLKKNMTFLKEVQRFYFQLIQEEDLLKRSPMANSIVYGMEPVLDEEIRKIMEKYNAKV